MLIFVLFLLLNQSRMKHFTLFAIALGLLGAPAAYAVSPAAMQRIHKTKTAKLAKKDRAHAEKADAPSIWCAGTEHEYEWADTEWELFSTHRLTYTPEGRVASIVDEPAYAGSTYTRTTNEYNPYGMLSSRLTEESENGVEYTNTRLLERQYDPAVKNLIVANYDFMWSGSEWEMMGNNYRRNVLRDNNGNVTLVEVSVYLNGIYDPTERLSIEYGADGKATSVKQTVLTTDYGTGKLVWQEGEAYTDIVWERTNGQIVDIAELTSINNRIKTATYWSEGEEIGRVTAEYTDERGSYRLTLAVDGLTSVETVDILDSYGSYDYTLTSTIEDDEASDMITVEKYHYDSYGLETLVYASETADGEEEIYMWTKGEVVYDPTYGYPLEYTLTDYDSWEDEWIPMMRIEYSDYTDMAGIGSIDNDNDNAPVEFYDLRGIRIAEPTAPGLYIRRQGSDARKVIIK